jgi:anti-sigma regulatory factor (Ser/Thr protein kinase)
MEIYSSLEYLRPALDYVTLMALQAKISQELLWKVQLGAEEALVNIMRYAYQDKVGIIEIECRNENGNTFSIQISDFGLPFDPTSRPLEEVNEIQTSGFGINLMRKVMDEVEYKRDGNKNILMLTCNLQHTKSKALQL